MKNLELTENEVVSLAAVLGSLHTEIEMYNDVIISSGCTTEFLNSALTKLETYRNDHVREIIKNNG